MEKIYADFKESYEKGLLQLLKALVGRKRLREVIRVPAGTFLWSEHNVSKEIERNFYIDQTCVTEGEFFRFAEETGYEHSKYKSDRPPLSTNALLPANFVNVADALAYCKWRSKIEGSVVRLPTAEEWEKAARGGDSRRFPWGDEDNFWFCNCIEFVGLENRGYKQRQPWDRFPYNVSPYGVHDMVGNVCEWTISDFQGPHAPPDRGPGTGQEIRGGAFVFPLEECACFSAKPRFDFDQVEYIGFRCVTEM
jgi:formylglycine-generating enzyme required for sulfatase activity